MLIAEVVVVDVEGIERREKVSSSGRNAGV